MTKAVPSIDDTSYVNPDVFERFDAKQPRPGAQRAEPAASKQARLKIVEPLKDCHLLDGNQAIFYCKVDAYPAAETSWLKDGQPLIASQRLATRYIGASEKPIILGSVKFHFHSF
jgi:hypothetical protein